MTPTTATLPECDVGLEILGGDALTAAEVARLLPRRSGRPLDGRAVGKLITRGVRLGRARVRLEGRRLGAAWWTSRAAIKRFLDRQGEALVAAAPEAT
jgi:hypothetical protein